ncbi:HpcH/HpaI aldolase/citrate lyase family protein [Falsirhodobacter algicola]|uniref:HpcH/HpaI aldolase/citrate lyase family protein n=1 Tax=Falsirhodobacter algicola TaxID=2692330 RepID=UPI0020112C18|nr:CoA ester lyase [Falsirhodobacter algicola]
MTDRPLRSALYVPATQPRALEKARTLPCDAIIFDLEDAVAPARKEEAQRTLIQTLRTADYGHRMRIVRVNGPEDLPAFADVPVDALLLPKLRGPDLPPSVHPLWAMIETAEAVLNVAAIAAHPAIAGLVMGTNDLMKDLHLPERPGRPGLIHALSASVLAARAARKPVLDGVHTALHDADGLRAEAQQGRDLGFDGKTVIHPAQIAAANAAFGPSADEIALARRQIEAHAAVEAAGQGVAVVDGRIVEALHADIARRILSHAAIIARTTGGPT